MLSPHITMSAWREILARVFDGFDEQLNVSPEWLVNPATRRRLKLDCYYPDAGVAVRFVGLMAKGQKRQSDWDVLETEQRDQTRAELCRQNDVQLAVIDPMDDPLKQLGGLMRILSRASRVLAQGDRPQAEKGRWMPALHDARSRLGEIDQLVRKNPEQMLANLAESWRDRESGMAAALQQAAAEASAGESTAAATPLTAQDLAEGQTVRHVRFGRGVVTKIGRSDDGATLSILFDAEQERTFLLSLIGDKLEVLHE